MRSHAGVSGGNRRNRPFGVRIWFETGCLLRVDRTYVGRMLRLTSLATDIVEAILRGDESDGLSLEKPRKNLPVRWNEQRRAYGRRR